MGSFRSTVLGLSVLLAGACAASSPARPASPASTPPPATRAGLQIRHAIVYVDDQDQAVRFYTDVLGFAVKDDVRNGPYRWLTVTAPGDRDGTELQLALADDPAASAYQEALFAHSQPATMFYTADVKAEHARLAAKGVEFTVPPTEVMPGSTIAVLKDTCGNLVQLTQLDR